jgi:N-acetylglucosaminyl-diphospho-decaprenol L-rhamnosyltransferase
VTANPELSIILVSFDDRAHLGACLEALGEAARRRPAEVILVDNHSQDGSPEFVGASFPWVKIIFNDRNVGYAKANNIGIRASTGASLLFLNTDTVVPADAPAALLGELDRRPEAAAIGPALVRPDGSFQVSFGRDIGFFAELRQKLVLNPYYRATLRRSRRPQRVGWLSGACLLARRHAVEAAGLFDENFFLYFEDIDLCRRLRDLGFELIFDPRVRVLHVGGTTTAGRRWRSRLHYRRSQLYYYEKHGSALSVRLLRAALRLDLLGLRLFRVRSAADRALLDDLRGEVSGRR